MGKTKLCPITYSRRVFVLKGEKLPIKRNNILTIECVLRYMEVDMTLVK